MATPNLTDFEELPTTQIGNIGVLFVKNRLLKNGFMVTDYSNTTSPVDLIVSREFANGEISQKGIEVKTLRPVFRRETKCFRINIESWERINDFAKRFDILVELFVVASSGEPHIWHNCISSTSFQKSSFVEKDNVYQSGKIVTVEFINFPLTSFECYDDLTQNEIAKLDSFVKKIDAYNNPQAKLPVTTIDDLEKQIKEDADRRAANPTLFDEPTPTIEVEPMDNNLIPAAEPERDMPKVIKIKQGRKIFTIKTPKQDFPLRMTKDDSGKWLVFGSQIFNYITNNQKSCSIAERQGLLSKCLKKVCSKLYDLASVSSEKKHTYLIPYKDVKTFLETAGTIRFRKSSYNQRNSELFEYWRKEILPRIKADTLEELFIGSTMSVKCLNKPAKTPARRVEKVVCETVDITPTAQGTNLLSEIIQCAKDLKKSGANGNSLKLAINFIALRKPFDTTPYLEFAKMAKDESFDEPARSTDEQSIYDGQSDARP